MKDLIKLNKTLMSLSLVFLVTVSIFSLGTVAAAQWDVGPGQKYTTIQSAVNNANTHNSDTSNVHTGTYKEDVLVNKKLTIQTISGADVALKPTNTGFTVVKDATGDGSGTIIKGFKIINSPNGIGIKVNANNCKIENNQITGGKTGIVVSGNNTNIDNNVIFGQSESGIQFLNSSGGYSTITGNKISNIFGNGATNGISLMTITIGKNLTGFEIVGNTISNIRSVNNEAVGILAFGITLFGEGLNDLIASGNVISNIYGFNKAAGLVLGNLVILTGKIPNVIAEGNKVSNVNSVNSSAIGIEVQSLFGDITNFKVTKNTITGINSYGKGSSSLGLNVQQISAPGFGGVLNFLVSQNKISQINGRGINSTSMGLSVVAITNGTALVSENQASELTAPISTIGIEAVNALGGTTLEKNTFSDINADTVYGIVAASFKNLDVLHNIVFQLNGAKTIGMIAGFNNTVIKGNNFEGNGIGTGILLAGAAGEKTINYNRIVNFQYYIANFNLEFFGLTMDEVIKLIDERIREEIKKHHSKITPEQEAEIIKFINNFFENFIKQIIVKNTNASYNWYGTNGDPGNDKFYKGSGTLDYYPWLVLNIKADPSTIYVGQTSTITADVYRDAAGGDHSADAAMFFSGPQVTFTTNLGSVGSKSVIVQWVNGLATAILRADEGAGIATVTATDYQTVQTFVTILGAAGGATKAIGMQETGVPLNYLLLAVLLVLGGLISPRRK